MSLPVVNTLIPPYEDWTTREPTHDERMQYFNETGCANVPPVNDQLQASYGNAVDLAKYIATVKVDNGLKMFIDDALDSDGNFQVWKKSMPSRTPVALSDYQQKFPLDDYKQVDDDICTVGDYLSEGQTLFHGGGLAL